MNEGDLSLACIGLLVDELARAGIAEACICPGSRSTAIALALARHPGIRTFVHLDERSAAYFALGMARATGRPAVVTCSSGTAAANLLPAVIEAAQDHVPLVVLTADRPPELRATGANQAIDQLRIFGTFATFVEAGTPSLMPGAAGYWRSLGARAATTATGPPAGAVHLNLAVREPLVPAGEAVDLGDDVGGRPDGQPWERVLTTTAPPVEGSRELARLVNGVSRGLITVGPTPVEGDGLFDLAARLRWPVLAEPGSGLRRGPALPAGQHLLADPGFAAAHVPDIVLHVGAAPTSRAALAMVAAAGDLVLVDPDGRRPDPGRRASLSIRAEPDALARAVTSRCEERPISTWQQRWLDADRAAQEAVASLLESWDEPFEGRVARDVHAALPDGGTLVVANSLPVRDLDAYALSRDGVRVLGNRGASGIDGFVSTALGMAAVTQPAWALSGDLSLLHDASGLAWGARRSAPAVIVVINNGGGAIFDLLPQAALPEAESLFVTPHGFDLGSLARALGATHQVVRYAAELLPALREAGSGTTLEVVEVVIDRASQRGRRQQVSEAVAVALGSAQAGSPVAART